jgi:hypothetical protein
MDPIALAKAEGARAPAMEALGHGYNTQKYPIDHKYDQKSRVTT